MKGPERLKNYEDSWETDMGKCFPGERVVVRGEDLFDSFQSSSWLEYLLFVVTGKRDEKLAHIIGVLWMFTGGYPDSRVWNNRIVTLAATTKSTGALGISAGIAVSEATLYGLKPIKGCSDFLVRLKGDLEKGGNLEHLLEEELRRHRVIYGYGRPIVSVDERIAPTIRLAKEYGYGAGYYLNLVCEIELIFKKKDRMQMNQGGLYAAIMLDAGLSVSEIYYLTIFLFSAGMFAPFIEAHDKPSGAFFPLRVSKINYTGSQKMRTWER